MGSGLAPSPGEWASMPSTSSRTDPEHPKPPSSRRPFFLKKGTDGGRTDGRRTDGRLKNRSHFFQRKHTHMQRRLKEVKPRIFTRNTIIENFLSYFFSYAKHGHYRDKKVMVTW